jgi:hypothetical protein
MKTMPKKNASEHTKTTLLTGPNDPLEQLLRYYLQDFIANNSAAKVVADGMRVIGIGFRPIIDHITFRTLDVEQRAKEFLKYGYKYDAKTGVIEYDNWWAKVYRKAGYPAIFIDQPFSGKRGKGCLIPDWVETFGDQILHHVSIQVDDIEQAVFFLEKQGVPMAGNILGDRGSDLRQIFTKPEVRKKKPFTVLELAERHRGYQGFSPPLPKA